MSTSSPAQFTINGVGPDSSGNKIYRATAGQTLTLTASDNPSKAVAFTYSIFDLNDPTSPSASATEIMNRINSQSFTFPNGLFAITIAPNASTTLTMYNGTSQPISGPLSFIIRCQAAMADGTVQIYERGVSLIAFPDNWREPCFLERDQFFTYGWGYGPLGLNMRNSFPQQSKYGSGSLSSVAGANVDILPGGKNRELIMIGQVFAKQNSGASALWGMRHAASVDGSGNITLDANAVGETLDGTVLEADFQPTFVVHTVSGVQYGSLRVDQKTGSKSFTWKAWFTLYEEPV